ncbi:MAG: hypothetical protein V4629_06800 [Pseudomonadota bacterium]
MPLTQRARRFIYFGVGLTMVLLLAAYFLAQSTAVRSWFLQTPSKGLEVKNISWDRWQTNSSQLVFYNLRLQASWRQQDVVVEIETLTLEGWGKRFFGIDWQSIHLDRAILEFVSHSKNSENNIPFSLPSDWHFFIDQIPNNFSFSNPLTVDQFRSYQNKTLVASGELALKPNQLNAKWISPHTHLQISKQPNRNLEIIANRMDLGLRLKSEFKNLQFNSSNLSTQIELSPKWLEQPKNTLAVLPGQIRVYPVDPISLDWQGHLKMDLSQVDLIRTAHFTANADVKKSKAVKETIKDVVKLDWKQGKWHAAVNLPVDITGSTEGLSGLTAKLFPHWTNDIYKLFNTYEIKADQQVDIATPADVIPSALWRAHLEKFELQGENSTWSFKTLKEGEWQLKNNGSEDNSIIATLHALEIKHTHSAKSLYWQGYLQDLSSQESVWDNLFHSVKLQQLKDKLNLDWSGEYIEESNSYLAKINASRDVSDSKFKLEANISSEKLSENLMNDSIFLPMQNELPEWFTTEEYENFSWQQTGETTELWQTLKSPTKWDWQTEKFSFNQNVWHPMQWKNIGFNQSEMEVKRKALAKAWTFEIKAQQLASTPWIKNINLKGEILYSQDPLQFQIDQGTAELLSASLVLHQPWIWSAEKNELPARWLVEKLSIQHAAETFGFPQLKSDLTINGVLPLYLALEKKSKKETELKSKWKIQRGLFSEDVQGKELALQAFTENTNPENINPEKTKTQEIPDMRVDRLRAEINILDTSKTPINADINAQISGAKKLNARADSKSQQEQKASNTDATNAIKKENKPITLNLNNLKVPLAVDSTEDQEKDPSPQLKTEPTRSE